MIRVTGVGRRMLIAAVGLCATALGWLLLYEVTSPGVAAKLTTAPLAAVLALQVLPPLGLWAWRMDRSLTAAMSDTERSEARVGALEATQPVVPAGVAAAVAHDQSGPRVTDVVAVHRVVHVPRARPRTQARSGDEFAAR